VCRSVLERLAGAAITAAALLLVFCAGTSAATYAPLDQPGPPLSVPVAALRASLQCQPAVRDAKTEPVLLSPGTGATPTENFGWDWEPALDKLGIPWCAYDAPHQTLGDIQTSGEYLVHAIRTVYALAGRKIAILGHSQGGMSMRWALRFWPDTRAMVDDVIAFAPSNHGTTIVSPSYCLLGCAPADLQQLAGSRFIEALNSRTETFDGVSYTQVYTHTDEVVRPNSSPATCSSCLYTGTGAISNIASQQICPGDLYEHVGVGTADPVAYAIGVDALRHAGPADPRRIARSVCRQPWMPGVVNPSNLAVGLQALSTVFGSLSVILPTANLAVGAPEVRTEPPLACYVFAACTGPLAPTLLLSYRRSRRKIDVVVGTPEGDHSVRVPGVTVHIAGRHAVTSTTGRAKLTITLRRGHRYRLIATRPGCNPAIQAITG
jgi:pimeloyl-ACP methyl ester carboxylesterase